MPESKKSGIDWKMVALNVLGIVGCYLLFQLINALLIAKEAVGEGRAPVLICLSAFLSVCGGSSMGGCRCVWGARFCFWQ